jgi:hypothetical protein
MEISSQLKLGAALLASTLTLVSSMPETARACSGFACGTPDVRPAGATTVPANIGGLFIGSRSHYSGDPAIDASVERLVGSVYTSIPTTVVPRPIEGQTRFAVRFGALTPGDTITLSATQACETTDDDGSVSPTSLAQYTVGPEVPLPTTLGSLTVTVELDGVAPVASSGPCFEERPTSYASVALVASDDASPWIGAMVFETLVDGELYTPSTHAHSSVVAFGGSWMGVAKDRVFAACGDLDGVSEGTHEIKLRGILPNGTVLETSAVSATLACPGSSHATGLGNANSGGIACSAGHAETMMPSALFGLGLLALVRRRSSR